MDITAKISEELQIAPWQTEAVINLIDEGNTIPFIARYRKEMHGALDDEVLRNLETRLASLRSLEERRAAILKSIEASGNLTEALKAEIDAAATLVALEDLYRPYKPKRRTRAMIAREKGLAPLAAALRDPQNKKAPLALAEAYVDAEKEIPDAAAALQMAEDIIAEEVSDNAQFRAFIRRKTMADGLLKSRAKDPKESTVYDNYYEYEEALSKIPGHRLLALNRGEKEKILRLSIEAPEEDILTYLELKCHVRSLPATGESVKRAIADAYSRLIAPSIENEIRASLTEAAEEAAITVFGKNLKEYLMQPPLAGKVVLGWDPAFRTGCKIAVVDPSGKVLETVVIFPTAPQKKIAEAKQVLLRLVEKHKVDVIAVGNGTASRESEAVIAEFIKECPRKLTYVIVNEAGASVYSASALATEEMPGYDVGERSAASIARRLQDPMAELVKIDPRSIGVGQYQHDMNQTRLSEALGGVVEDCVNHVGVDVNTASAALLSYIAGINKTVAANVVAYREANGPFKSRRDLRQVPKLGPKAFTQCAGFLRIRNGEDVLDMTAVHPESYPAARALMKEAGITEEALREGRTEAVAAAVKGREAVYAKALGIGEFTLRDIIAELSKPGRDVRSEAQGVVLRQDVLEMKDLAVGMELTGTVRNVIDFGAFVDIGVHQDGLVHISQLSDKYVKHPLDVVHVGQIVKVKVISLDLKKQRIGLTMKGVSQG